MLPTPRRSAYAARAAAAAALAALAAAGCSSIVENRTPTPVTYFRVVQAASDATSGVDLRVNGATAATGLPFGSLAPASQYVPFPATPQIAVFATGSTTAFYDQPAPDLVANRAFTLVVLGQTGSGATPAATVTALADTTAGSANSVLLRLFNAVDYLPSAAGGDPVDVYIYPQGAARPATPDAAGLAWNARTAYLAEDAGALQVDVFPAGAASTGTPAFSTTFSAPAGAVGTCILRDPPSGSAAGTAGGVLVLNDRS